MRQWIIFIALTGGMVLLLILPVLLLCRPEATPDKCQAISFEDMDARESLRYIGRLADQLHPNDTQALETLGIIVRHLTAPSYLHFPYNLSKEIADFKKFVWESYCQ